MLTDVNEAVEVVAVFRGNKAFPSVLKWSGRIFKITQVNMVHQMQEGDALLHCFSVSDSTNYFKLIFNTKTLQWFLDQVYTEG